MYPMGEKYAPPLPSTIGELGRRGPKVAGWWLDCDDQGIHGELVGMGWWVGIDGSIWWDVEPGPAGVGGSIWSGIPDATPCTYRHPAGLDALIDVVRHSA